MKKEVLKNSVLFTAGFCIYITIEVLFRGYSFRAMGIVGGLAMIFLGTINDVASWDIPLEAQAVLGGAIVTTMEYIVGMCDRFFWHIGMWDYSTLPFSDRYGVVNLYFFFAWCGLAVIGILIADCITYYMFHDTQRPYYRGITGRILFQLPERECSSY